jgi:hypothetical protein
MTTTKDVVVAMQLLESGGQNRRVDVATILRIQVEKGHRQPCSSPKTFSGHNKSSRVFAVFTIGSFAAVAEAFEWMSNDPRYDMECMSEDS